MGSLFILYEIITVKMKYNSFYFLAPSPKRTQILIVINSNFVQDILVMYFFLTFNIKHLQNPIAYRTLKYDYNIITLKM